MICSNGFLFKWVVDAGVRDEIPLGQRVVEGAGGDAL